jgi:hypothetical protein
MSKIIALVLLCGVASAQDPRQIVQESQRRTRSQSQRYQGILEVTGSGRKVTTKRWIYERIGSFGDSKAIIRFTEPAEVKGVALLVVNHKDRSADQWMWTPATGRERRIALQDRSTRFFGTDFSFEDLEERDADQFDFRLEGEENIDNEKCWRIESRPRKGKTSQYTQSLVWVRQSDFAPAKLENFSDESLVRRLLYRQIDKIQGIPTARVLDMTDLKRNSRTLLKLEQLEYNVDLKDEQFTLQALKRQN